MFFVCSVRVVSSVGVFVGGVWGKVGCVFRWSGCVFFVGSVRVVYSVGGLFLLGGGVVFVPGVGVCLFVGSVRVFSSVGRLGACFVFQVCVCVCFCFVRGSVCVCSSALCVFFCRVVGVCFVFCSVRVFSFL